MEKTKELLSNLADKSQQTLRLFAQSERVEIDVLVGKDMPYKDINDLKRSFVGAVNRRLRTVLGDRGVVLFSSESQAHPGTARDGFGSASCDGH